MKDEKFTYHETDSKDLLITQYKNKPNFKKLMGIVGKRTQNIENKLEVFYSRLNIDSMDGVNLDMIGNVLILERKGLSDNDYKFDLKIQIALLSSMGNTEDIINFISLVTGANRIYMKENFPASVGIFSNQSISDYLAEKIKKKYISYFRQV